MQHQKIHIDLINCKGFLLFYNRNKFHDINSHENISDLHFILSELRDDPYTPDSGYSADRCERLANPAELCHLRITYAT